MILDRLDNWQLYYAPDSPVGRGLRWLATEFDPATPDGRVDIDGDNLFVLVQGYDTRPADKCRFESHERYLDIQYVYTGGEGMGWAPRGSIEIEEPYSTEKDVAFHKTPARYAVAAVTAGEFAIFYPTDAHQPCMRIPGHDNVRKAVVKVRL